MSKNPLSPLEVSTALMNAELAMYWEQAANLLPDHFPLTDASAEQVIALDALKATDAELHDRVIKLSGVVIARTVQAIENNAALLRLNLTPIKPQIAPPEL